MTRRLNDKIDYGLKEINEMDYGLQEMNEIDYDLIEMNDANDKNRGYVRLSDDVMMEV